MTDAPKPSHFLRTIIREDLEAGRVSGVVTRFPPEPNGYLHIGHAKSICVNFGLAQEFGGVCNLRFDDTNPSTEDVEYVDSIIRDVSWLGYSWDGEVRYASDYFATLYGWAQHLVRERLAYVCELGPDEMREYRGTLTEPGRNSPWRDRPVAESLELLEQMRQGSIEEGRMTLRARIDMGSPNLNLRDPVLYRVKHAHHHRTGNALAHLPVLRLRARAGRRHRARHAFDLHAGVRGPPPAVRVVHREPAGTEPPAPVRVRAHEPELHRHQQAQAAPAGRGRARAGLGRSAHADDLGPAPPWRQPGRDPRLRRAHGCEPLRRTGRPRHVRLLHPRRPRQERPARDVRAAAR